jgi:hypothetical protein
MLYVFYIVMLTFTRGMIRNVRFVPKGVGKVDVNSACNPK